MRFKFYQFNELPKLAWCAVCQSGTETVRVLLGPWVENRESFFCEGAWDGEFQKGELDEGFMMGSGGRITDDGNVLFATPNHTLERLYSVRASGTLHVSNSLAFLLSTIDDELDPGHFYYRAILHSIRYGIRKCRRSIPTLKRRRIRLHYYCNIIVSPDLTVTEIPKHMTDDFLSFEHYTSFLKDTVTRICRNAVDKGRVITYQPIATISSGYDSAASAVFAREVGCTEAITFQDQDDSGAEIARILGMDAREYDRHDYLSYNGFPEAEFCACGISAMDTVWLVFEHAIQQRLLFTGTRGLVWDKNWRQVSRDIDIHDPYHAFDCTSETGLAEFRLRVGFIILPVPYVGITNHPSIHSISTSSEMRPWSVGGDYDKPIARRILEEAGVNREMFGQKEKGAWLTAEEAKLTEASRSDFINFCSENWNLSHRVLAMVTNLFVLFYAYLRGIKFKIDPVLERIGLHIKWPLLVTSAVQQRLLLRIDKESLLPHWGINKISVRYRVPDVLRAINE